MEIDKSSFDQVKSYIERANDAPSMELEVRFWGDSIKIDEKNFKNIFEYYTFRKENDGLGCDYTMSSSLDVYITFEGNNRTTVGERTRLTIESTSEVKKYWLENRLSNIQYEIMEKKRLDQLDIQDYQLRVSLNDEIPKEEIYEKNKKNFTNENAEKQLKYFRLKNRYSIITPDRLFSIDLTMVKSGSGKTFREANVLKAEHTYEVEIEYIGNKETTSKNTITPEEVCNKLFEHLHTILSIIHDSEYILKQSMRNQILQSYYALIRTYRDESANKMKPETIFANPVTMHRFNVIKSTKINIYNHYTVSLKADGLRVCCFVAQSSNPEVHGNIYLIDVNNHVIDTGLKDEKYANSIIEGEYLKENSTGKYVLYAYDMLFDRGNDIRRRQYFNTYKEERLYSRSHYLDQFIRSSSRTKRMDEIVDIVRKEYKVSQVPDGADIFEKAHELWKDRMNQPFFVDGMIFTPMYEYYPMKTGSWYSLLKWKPEMLNTIDFLISVVKSSTGGEMKFPYLHSVLREDGKIDTTVKQYKKIRLFVSTFKQVYDEKQRRMVGKKVKALFNPYGLDETGAEAYNTAYIFLDENDKMICTDPLSGEQEEMKDDTIVELGFDQTLEKGFQWVPYRVRHDKTTSYKSGRDVFGNLDNTANDIFRSLQYPITEEMITTGKNIPLDERGDGAVNAPSYYANIGNENVNGDRLPYQNFHNHHIKTSLFMSVSPSKLAESTTASGKIFDMCCGKGVDIKRIKAAKYKEVVGMDFDLENIKFAQKYYDRVLAAPKPKAYYVRGDAGKLIFPNQDAGITESDKMQIAKFIPTKYAFDVVNVQFAIHYFFENEVRLRSFLQNVNDSLKIGGFFIGTCFDGERVHQMMKGANQIEGKTYSGETLWKIEKKFITKRMSFDASKANFGKQIDVFVKSIGNVHSEYLVNFNYLDAILEEYGFTKVMVKPFSQYYEELLKSEHDEGHKSMNDQKNLESAKKMSEEEQRFSFLNNAFVYKKVSNTSDALFKKLVHMLEDQVKREKKSATPEVEVLDESTAHLVAQVAIKEEEETKEEVQQDVQQEVVGAKRVKKRTTVRK